MSTTTRVLDGIIDSIKLSKMKEGSIASYVAGHGLTAAFSIYDYHNNREQGKGVLSSAASAIGTNVMGDVLGPGKFLAMQAIPEIMKGSVHAYEGLSKMARDMGTMGMNKPFYNSTFVDNQQNYTMRQAGMQMAKASKYNIQQAMLGNEANYMHL